MFIVLCDLKGDDDMNAVYEKLMRCYESVKEKYLSNDGEGLNLFIYDETFCELRRTGLVVKSSILQDSSFALQKSNIVE